MKVLKNLNLTTSYFQSFNLLFLLMSVSINAQPYYTLNFYRTNSFGEPRQDMEVFINDEKILKMQPGSRFSYISSGEELLRIHAVTKRCETSKIRLEPVNGRTYYIKVDGNTCFVKDFDLDIGERAFYNGNDFDYDVVELRDDHITDEWIRQQELQAQKSQTIQQGPDSRVSTVRKDPSLTGPAGQETTLVTGTYHALIIGISDYQDQSINDLDNPIRDARKLYSVLNENYYFDKENMILLENPSRAEIIETLDKLTIEIEPDDNLLIFYAGHGHWDANMEQGFWLPADSRAFSSANWLRNTTLQSYISSIPSKHTLLVADACFSGGIFKTRRAFTNAPLSYNKLHQLSSRKAMTSGTLKEVPDESVFIQYLIKRLTENTQTFVSSEQLFASFREAVLNNSPNVPQFGTIQNTGDEGGDFIFIRREKLDFR